MIQIAAIEPAGRLYGSEFCLLDIVAGLPSSEFDWRVFLPAGNGFDRLLVERQVSCEFLIPRNLNYLSKFRKVFVYARVLNRLRQLRPALLYVNQAGSLRAAAMYAKILGLPIVCQVQTLEDARWLSGQPALHRDVYAFICNSEFIAKQTIVDCDRKCVLYQGVGDHRVERTLQYALERSSRTFDASPTFGILGRIAVSKGHYLLLDAVRRLGEKLPRSRIHVIGEGLTPADSEAFVQAVADAGMNERFVFRGYRSDLQNEFAAIDVLLIPSIAEPLGRVLLDAAEYNVPVIISDTGGLGELGIRFSIGKRFHSGDSSSLADAMVSLAGNLQHEQSCFSLAAVGMMGRLGMSGYLNCIAHILESASRRQVVAARWLGT